MPTFTPQPLKPVNFLYRFSYSSVKVGQKYGSLTVSQIKPIRIDRPIGTDNIAISFRGQLKIVGNFSSSENAPFTNNSVCISNISPETAINLPRFSNDTRLLWFCFDNQDKAYQLLGPVGSSGTATFIIDNYTTVNYGGAAWDTATLISVKSKK